MHVFSEINQFPRSAKYFLSATIINGIIFNAWSLFFNFFILARGFDKQYLGLVNSMPSIAGLLMGIPLGMLSDRIGRRKAMLFGLGISTAAMVFQLLFTHPYLIAVMAFIGGAGNSLYFISQAPFMMKVTNPENRAFMFSLNFGLTTLSGAVGNLFAGQMPGWFANLLAVAPDSAQAYQAVLLVSVIFGFIALLPVYLIKEEDIGTQVVGMVGNNQWQLLRQTIQKRMTWKLVLPEMLLGFGAAITIPYMNLFFSESFSVSSNLLGLLFSLSSLFVGVGSIIGPRLVKHFGSKIRVVVLTQTTSILFLLVLAFSPFVWLAAIGFLLRGMLMNMAVPLYNAFCMENVQESEQGVVNSLISNAWTIGWAIGPFLSGLIQVRFGFQPLFLSTAMIYLCSIAFTWFFFNKLDQPIPMFVPKEEPVP